MSHYFCVYCTPVQLYFGSYFAYLQFIETNDDMGLSFVYVFDLKSEYCFSRATAAVSDKAEKTEIQLKMA